MLLHRIRVSGLCLLALAAVGCDKAGDDNEYAVVSGDASGCIQGVVTDALTSERIALDTARIYTVYNNSLYEGLQKLTDNVAEARKAEVVGDYRLCGVPNAGIQLPLYVKVEGYQNRIYGVSVTSKTPDRNSGTPEPGFWVTPSVIQNVQLFKLQDLQQKDFVVTVTHRGAVLADAAVWLEPTPDVATLPLPPLKATTDASGNATFAAASIAFGASYTVSVLPKTPIAGDGSTSVAITSSSVTLGVAGAVDAAKGLVATDPFSLHYDVGLAATGAGSSAPELVTSSPAGTVSETGAVSLVFDRDVEVNVGTTTVAAGTTVAVASFGNKADGSACVAADAGSPTTDPTKSVLVTVSGRIVTLTPVWATAPSTATCGGISLTYTLTALTFYGKGTSTATATTGTNVTIFLSKPFVQ